MCEITRVLFSVVSCLAWDKSDINLSKGRLVLSGRQDEAQIPPPDAHATPIVSPLKMLPVNVSMQTYHPYKPPTKKIFFNLKKIWLTAVIE